jgi:phosphoenolpyruvate carboxylase
VVSPSVLTLDVEKLYRDWSWVLGCLREVLESDDAGDLAKFLPEPGQKLAEQVDEDSVRLTQAYSIAFQLLSMAEQHSASQFRKLAEAESGLDSLPALWGECLRHLKNEGWESDALAAELPHIHVELVLTAHPTEAKRATVLAHHRRLYERLRTRDRTDLPPWNHQDNEQSIRALLAILWRTGEIYLDKPDVQSERRNVIDYLTHVFPLAIRPLDIRLRQAWAAVGLDSQSVQDPLSLPRLTFGTWVGGDRDGHPLVTAEVTRQSLAELRTSALGLVHRQLAQLARLMSLSAYWIKPKPEFLAHIAAEAERLGEDGKRALARNPNEPWRQFINLMSARLPRIEATQHHGSTPGNTTPAGASPVPPSGTGLGSGTTHSGFAAPPACSTALEYKRATELLDDLRRLYQSLVDVGERRIADHAVQPVMRIVQTFGFHLAVLDIRQNSQWHDRAVEQLLQAAGLECADFSKWPEEQRLEFLQKELTSRRPFARPEEVLGAEADAVLACFRVIKQTVDLHGPDGLGALIVSMTHRLSDLLVVYLFAREVGLLKDSPDGAYCPLPVVPLFETIDDLVRSPTIYEQFLRYPLTKHSLEKIRQYRGAKEPGGQIMIGYSDSNKDGGIVASLVGLRRAQHRLAKIGREMGVRVQFFHGRGGTISRGAGPTHRFIRAFPDHSLQGDLRLTEQGETIPQKYAHQSTAIYNLELFLAGVTRKTLGDLRSEEALHPLEATLDRLAGWGQAAYSELLHQDGFVSFFRQATPIDAIEQSSIGSRPSRRTGQQTLADLRAIPWVFSWGQARFYLSGWYGVGTALAQLKQTDPDAFQALHEQLLVWSPLHYLISNVATSVAAADERVMRAYAALVEDAGLREHFMGKIENELQLTRQLVAEVYGGSLEDRRPNVQRMIALRSEGLRILHQQQIGLLRTWRAYKRMGETQEAAALVPRLLLTVNAIASGLGSTG